MNKKIILAVILLVGVCLIWLWDKNTNFPKEGGFPLDSSVEVIALQIEPTVFAERSSYANATIIDIRTAEEYANGHLSKSINSDFYNTESFTSYLKSLDRTKKYFVYCRSGSRSAQAMKLFKELGFVEVYELEGGINAWQAAGLPVVK